MNFTPHITIYFDEDIDRSYFNHLVTKASWIYSKNLGYNDKLNRKRVNIHLGKDERPYEKTSSTIKSTWRKNKIDTNVKASDVEKINQLLFVIYSGILEIAAVEEWDINSIIDAYKASLTDGGKFIWLSPFKLNRKRNKKARIRIVLDADKAEISANIFDVKDKNEYEVKIIDTFPHEIDWSQQFKNPKWIDDEKFGFAFLKSQLLIYIDSILKQSVTTILEKESSKEEVEGFLRSITYRQFASEEDKIEWITQ